MTIMANAGSSISIGGYVAGGFNDGKGHGAVGNTVWLEATSIGTSKLTVNNFIVGGYLRSGAGSTNGNTVVIKTLSSLVLTLQQDLMKASAKLKTTQSFLRMLMLPEA